MEQILITIAKEIPGIAAIIYVIKLFLKELNCIRNSHNDERAQWNALQSKTWESVSEIIKKCEGSNGI